MVCGEWTISVGWEACLPAYRNEGHPKSSSVMLDSEAKVTFESLYLVINYELSSGLTPTHAFSKA